jgi:hypothetical protein
MRYTRQEMKTYRAVLSNGKVAKITAPSVQRANARMESTIEKQGLDLKIVSIDIWE